jgi:hypothetical protein
MCLLLHHVAGGIPAAVAAIGLLQLLWPNCAFAGLSPDVPAATPHARRGACRCCTCCCCCGGIGVASAAVDQSRILRPLHYPDKPDCRTLHAAHAEAAATGGPGRLLTGCSASSGLSALTPMDWHCSRVTLCPTSSCMLRPLQLLRAFDANPDPSTRSDQPAATPHCTWHTSCCCRTVLLHLSHILWALHHPDPHRLAL